MSAPWHDPKPQVDVELLTQAGEGEFSLSHLDFLEVAHQVISAGHSLRFRALGSSMWPQIRSGDVLIVKPCPPEALQVGDPILYIRSDNQAIVHRVVKIILNSSQPSCLTRGDALPEVDEPVPIHQVLGRVVAYERSGQQVNLDTLSNRISARLWVALQPVLRLAYQGARRLKTRIGL